MRKKKNIMKDLSNEIFENPKEENNHDIFANKDNLFIENTNATPKLEEEKTIELAEINSILEDNINNINEVKPLEENNNPKIEDKTSLNDLNNEIEQIEDKTSLNDINKELEDIEAANELAEEMDKHVNIDIQMPEIDKDIKEIEPEEYEETLNDYSNDEDEIDEEVIEENEDDTTFNELNKRILDEEIKEEPTEITTKSNFPKLDKFGTVTPVKNK